jgi:dihydropteroate synthase
MFWKTSRRKIKLERPLVMGILNTTPDSFSDGGRFSTVEAALRRVEEMAAEGADIIDIGGQSTRPGSKLTDEETELRRTIPVIEAVAKRSSLPISIDTFRAGVAKAAIDAGAEIINDISGLRWTGGVAEIAGAAGAGLVIMHSRGDFAGMHSQPPVDDILGEVLSSLRRSVETARAAGVEPAQIVLDVGIGFGKTPQQNFELIARLDSIGKSLREFPLLVGASRKSFLAAATREAEPTARLGSSIAAAIFAVRKGARIVRVHDVRETRAALDVLTALQKIEETAAAREAEKE